jgi:hypothetical protein
MAYMDKYPLYIKSVDYNYDHPENVDCMVIFADDSKKHITTKAELLLIQEQLAEQVKALAAGEVIRYPV